MSNPATHQYPSFPEKYFIEHCTQNIVTLTHTHLLISLYAIMTHRYRHEEEEEHAEVLREAEEEQLEGCKQQ